ncbi:MAG: acyl carrier protein [Clostridia bacterium]|nr:acyl carrier protein [Clostridia bacterium]
MFEEIKSIMMETLSIPEDQITAEANLEADLGISSLELYELGGKLMEVYDIEIEEEEIHSFITVQDIVDYIESHT